MKKYYVDPLTGKTADSKESLLNSSKFGIDSHITFVVDNEDGYAIECVDDDTICTMYINVQLPISLPNEAIADEAIRNIIPKSLDFSVENSIYSIEGKTFTGISIHILDYSKLPMLNGELLSNKLLTQIIAVIKG